MPDYKEMYLTMVRESEKAITAAQQAIGMTEQALDALIAAQRRCEEMYINAPDPILRLLDVDGSADET